MSGGLTPGHVRSAGRLRGLGELVAGAAARLVLLARADDDRGAVRRRGAAVDEPLLRDADTLALARAAAERLGEERVHVSGEGTTIETDVDSVDRGVAALVQCTLRHGGLDEVDVAVSGAELRVSPVTEASAPVVLGQDLRDLGAAVAVRLLERLGGEVAVADGTLTIRLPS